MKRPAVFFDRDNTLIRNDGFLGDPDKVVLMEGAARAVARARGMGYATVTISNQSGVARGIFEEEDVQRVNARMDELLAADDGQAIFERHEFCPFHPDGNIDVYRRESERRKPAPGMILSAAQKLELDLAASWVIGDAARDVEAGRAAGCRTILLRAADGQEAEQETSGETDSVEAESAETSLGAADFTAQTLEEALDLIEKNSQAASAQNAAAPATEKPWLAAAQQARAAKLAGAAAPPGVKAAQNAVVESAASTEAAENPGPGTARLSQQVGGPAHLLGEPGGPPPAIAGPSNSQGETGGAGPEGLAVSQAADPPTAAPDAAPTQQATPASSTRMEHLMEQLLGELRRRHEQEHTDFSVTKLLAGIVQVMALAAVLLAYMRGQGTYLQAGIYLQVLTIALLIMGRQR